MAFGLFFEKGRRKYDNDDAFRWNPSEAYPVFTTGYPSYLSTEANMLLGLEESTTKMEAKKNPLGLGAAKAEAQPKPKQKASKKKASKKKK